MNVKEVKKQLLRIVRAKINHRDQVPVILLISNYHPDQVPVILSISNYHPDQVPVILLVSNYHPDQVPVILSISNYHPDQVPVILSISNYRRDQVPVFDGNHKNRLWFIPGTADLSREKPTAPGPLGTNKIYKRRFKYE